MKSRITTLINLMLILMNISLMRSREFGLTTIEPSPFDTLATIQPVVRAACAVNGREQLTCITPIRSTTKDGGIVKIDPLRNFPIVSDLVVDMGNFFIKMDRSRFESVARIEDACLPYEKEMVMSQTPGAEAERLVDCIECGLCISACPASNTDEEYVGPAVLAAIHLMHTQEPSQQLIDLADHHTGLWRCHSAYECTYVCPAGVDPAWRIMDMRNKVFGNRIKSIFKRQSREVKNK